MRSLNKELKMSAVKTMNDKGAVPTRDTMPNVEPYTIRCYLYSTIGPRTWATVMSHDRLLGAQALRLLIRLDRELREARADWNQDRFRRVMRARSKAVARLFRRWARISPPPAIPLGSLRRRYHANLAGSLYKSKQ